MRCSLDGHPMDGGSLSGDSPARAASETYGRSLQPVPIPSKSLTTRQQTGTRYGPLTANTSTSAVTAEDEWKSGVSLSTKAPAALRDRQHKSHEVEVVCAVTLPLILLSLGSACSTSI